MATARELLDQKLVNGEITEEEYDRLAAKLSGKLEAQSIISTTNNSEINYRLIINIAAAIAAAYFSYKTIILSMAIIQLPNIGGAEAVFFIGVIGSIFAVTISIIKVKTPIYMILKIVSAFYYIAVLFFLFLSRGNIDYQMIIREQDQFVVSDVYILSGILALIALFVPTFTKAKGPMDEGLTRRALSEPPKWLMDVMGIGVLFVMSVMAGVVFSVVMRAIGLQGSLIPILALIVVVASFLILLRRYSRYRRSV